MSKGGAPSEQQKKLDEMLRNARVVEQQVLRTVREEKIIFRGCNLEMLTIVDSEESRKVQGFQLSIVDPHEHKTYVFQFGQEIMQDLNMWVNSAPNVGEQLEASE